MVLGCRRARPDWEL